MVSDVVNTTKASFEAQIFNHKILLQSVKKCRRNVGKDATLKGYTEYNGWTLT